MTIINKEHHRTIKAESTPGEGSTFIIQIPGVNLKNYQIKKSDKSYKSRLTQPPSPCLLAYPLQHHLHRPLIPNKANNVLHEQVFQS